MLLARGWRPLALLLGAFLMLLVVFGWDTFGDNCFVLFKPENITLSGGHLSRAYHGSSEPAPPEKCQCEFMLMYDYYPQILGFGSGGRDTLVGILKVGAQEARASGRTYTLMEIGVWLGAGLSIWLDADPNMHAIGIDPFGTPDQNHSKLQDVPVGLKSQFGHPDFNRQLAEYVVNRRVPDANRRFSLITGFSPEAAKPVLSQAHTRVDAFYIDGGKMPDKIRFTKYINESLHVFHSHNRYAILSGDDWSHRTTPTLQGVLKAFAVEKGLQLAQAGHKTWMMAVGLEKHLSKTKSHKFQWEVQHPDDFETPSVAYIMNSLR